MAQSTSFGINNKMHGTISKLDQRRGVLIDSPPSKTWISIPRYSGGINFTGSIVEGIIRAMAQSTSFGINDKTHGTISKLDQWQGVLIDSPPPKTWISIPRYSGGINFTGSIVEGIIPANTTTMDLIWRWLHTKLPGRRSI